MENTNKKAKWALDPTHSEILFKTRHMMIASVKGEFKNFNVEFGQAGDDFSGSAVRTVVDAASVQTNSEDRDKHLRSADFFDADNHKEIVFEGTSFVKTAASNYKLSGNLIIRGISKEVTLDVEFGGFNKDPWGNDRAGFSLTGKINRKDWGLNWNAVLETSGVLVSDDVQINAEVQFIKQSNN
jgi:polyisoprenoid-binding protein YceI